jgi:choline dehydrogenase-like flavoprotein
VEKFAGISGNRDNIASLPDGEFLPPLELSCVENYFSDVVKQHFDNRHVIYGRCAHLTVPQKIHLEQGRAQCQKRNLCQRGCPFGGYFSSNSVTLPWAEKTGNLTMISGAVVHSIIYDEKTGKASGVAVIDAKTHNATEYFARVIFVNAAALNTNLILLNSTSKRFPNGLGNDNGLLGKYVAFHNYRARVSGKYDGFLDKTTDGRSHTSAYIPRFRNVEKQETDFLRGYAAGFSANRGIKRNTDGFGMELKNNLEKKELGLWNVGSHMMGETIPKESNYVALDKNKKDEWGMPLLSISIDYDNNDEKMVKDYQEQMTMMFEKAGFQDITTTDSKQAPGLDIHEMGGVRMGHDTKTSMLNKWNQLHECKNVFVTDGACMTSTSTQNPSLTYMALTARAADYAMSEMKKGNL